MPVQITPSNTPTNTPTPSNTPSNTPTNTPSSSSCGDIPQTTPTQTPTNTQTGTPTNTPTNTQTGTPTPSATQPITQYYYYEIVKYDCNNSCAVVLPNLVGRSVNLLSTTDGMYRKIGDYVYQVQTILDNPASPFIDLDTATNTDLDCGQACESTFYYSYTTRLAENSISEVCTQPNTIVFSDSPTWQVGMVLYSTATPPTILSGYRYVNPLVEGGIYNLNIGTGIVGIYTGSNC